MLSDILPTGFECGVLNGKVQPGATVAIVGSGPIGLAALLTAQFYSPAEIIMIDLDDNRLEVAKRFGATADHQQHRRQGGRDGHEADRQPRRRHRHRGGRHPGHLRAVREDHRARRHHRQHRRARRARSTCIWSACGTATSPSPRGWSTPSRTPMLLKTCSQSHKIDPKLLITHRFKLDRHPRRLRDLRQRRQDQGAEGASSKPERRCNPPSGDSDTTTVKGTTLMTYQSLNPFDGKLAQELRRAHRRAARDQARGRRRPASRPGGTRPTPSGRSSSPRRRRCCTSRPTNSPTP